VGILVGLLVGIAVVGFAVGLLVVGLVEGPLVGLGVDGIADGILVVGVLVVGRYVDGTPVCSSLLAVHDDEMCQTRRRRKTRRRGEKDLMDECMAAGCGENRRLSCHLGLSFFIFVLPFSSGLRGREARLFLYITTLQWAGA
jgi:hypothetical protein